MARAGLTADRVTAAAADLADEVGLDGVTVSEVARGFGVKTASLYSHVSGSHDLRLRIALLALHEMAELVTEAVAGRAGRDALGAYADVYRSYAREHPGRYAAAQLRLDAETAARSDGARHAAVVRAILRGYDVEGDEQTHAVRLIGSTIHGYVTLELGGGFSHSAPDTDVTWARVLDALDALLRSWPEPT
jgi:AcrR family transcriptional regulator